MYDPFVPEAKVNSVTYRSATSVSESVRGADCVIIATDHKVFRKVRLKPLAKLMGARPLLYDARNIRSRQECERAGFYYLATGRPL